MESIILTLQVSLLWLPQGIISLVTVFNSLIGLHFLIFCSNKFIHNIKLYICIPSWMLFNLLISLIFLLFYLCFCCYCCCYYLDLCLCVFWKGGICTLGCNAVMRFLAFLLIHLQTLAIMLVYQD